MTETWSFVGSQDIDTILSIIDILYTHTYTYMCIYSFNILYIYIYTFIYHSFKIGATNVEKSESTLLTLFVKVFGLRSLISYDDV